MISLASTAPATVSLCTFFVNGYRFGVDTRAIREVLGNCSPERVPLSPRYLAGVVAYRGEVLTVVDLRALFAFNAAAPPRQAVVVLEGAAGEDHGLLADRLGGVITLDSAARLPNPATLDARCRRFFAGSFCVEGGLVVELTAARLDPAALDGVPAYDLPEAAPVPPLRQPNLYAMHAAAPPSAMAADKAEPCAS